MNDPHAEQTRKLDDLPAMASVTGQAGYEIFELLGRGGMGEVYRGRHVLLDKEVAIKMVTNASDDIRFLREARLAARVSSPNAVTVFDFQMLPDGRAMLVMEFIRGQTLERSIASGGPLSAAQLRRYMADGARGMVAVSEVGIVHRDLKPANMLIDSQQTLRIADFGIARLNSTAGDSQSGTLTSAGLFMGTPLYIAPEQAEDAHSADLRSDMYSFGATFYHAATGEPAFTGPSAFAVLLKHKSAPLIAPKSRRPDMPGDLNSVIERCMAKNPSDRFQSFDELLDSVEGKTADSWQESDDPAVRHYLHLFQEHRSMLLAGRTAASEPLTLQFPNGRSLSIQHGDLTTAGTDAVVSSDDDELSMGGGVSAALNRASGGVLEAEAKIYSRVRQGGVVVTGAGALPSKYVFHAVTIDYKPDKHGHVRREGIQLPSRDIILQLISGCFYHARTLQLQSLAFPLLGTGAGGFPRDVALDTMVTQLIRVMLHGAHSVERVVVFLY